MNRRDFLRGVIVAAPAVILTPGLLMKIKPREIIKPNLILFGQPEVMGFVDGNVLNATEVRAWMAETEKRIAASMAADVHALLTETGRVLTGMEWVNREYEKSLLLGPYPFKLKLRGEP